MVRARVRVRLPATLLFSHALRGGGGGGGGARGGEGVGEGVGEGSEGGAGGAGGEGGAGGAGGASELEELWRAAALGVAACALRQQQYALAQAACRRVVTQCLLTLNPKP